MINPYLYHHYFICNNYCDDVVYNMSTNDEVKINCKSDKVPFDYLKKGTRQKRLEQKPKQTFLKKGEGKLASDSHGETQFSKKRNDEVIREQIAREMKKPD